MTSGRFRFGAFTLDPDNRTLRSGDIPIEVNARYLDALILLVRQGGGLTSKDQFLEQVWRGVPVTDEALTQCIKTLRRHLGDDASAPRFIETVPKHGYRFVATIEHVAGPPAPPSIQATPYDGAERYSWPDFLRVGGAGTLGAGVAGVVGGLFYGSVGAANLPGTGTGISVLLVLLWLTTVAALVGGASVSFGIAAAGFLPARAWRVAGGAISGLVIGGLVKLLGLDAFSLLLDRTPGDITGAPEGLVLGASVGLGSYLARDIDTASTVARRSVLAALTGSAGAVLVVLLGGRLMGGSLNLLSQAFPTSRLRVDQLGLLFGERGFGSAIELATAAMEGALFGGCIVGAMSLVGRTARRPATSGVALAA